MTKAKVNLFVAMMAQAVAQATKAEDTRKALEKEFEKKLSDSKKQEREAMKELNLLKRIELMVERDKNPEYDTTIHEWYLRYKHGERGWNREAQAWSEHWYFITAEYEFTVRIVERTDLKRDKWVVTVDGRRESVSDERKGSSYLDSQYVKEKYAKTKDYVWQTANYRYTYDAENVLELKFNSEDKARAWAHLWMERLVRDHFEEIKREANLIKAIREL